MKRECNHKRIKRNFPHGKNHKPLRKCKDCGKPIRFGHTDKSRRKRQ